MLLYDKITASRINGKKQLAVLIDPDDADLGRIEKLVDLSIHAGVDFFFVGGSTSRKNKIDEVLTLLNVQTNIPIVLFPGNQHQIRSNADALLLLSLISGRNPEYLIGQHVRSVPTILKSNLEVIPCGYILVDGGKMTAVNYVSQTSAIDQNDVSAAINTALAGQFLGLKMLYLEAGSGASTPVNDQLISSVSNAIDIPLIVGGGIKTTDKALSSLRHGADLIVIGNAFEDNPSLVEEVSQAIHSENRISIELD